VTTRDDFEYWLADMDDALDRFIASLPTAVAARLDYSVASLDDLERWILDRWTDPRAAIAPTESGSLGGAARYIGETIRKHAGGFWDIDLAKRRNVYFGMPVIIDDPAAPTPVCPLTLATTCTDRRTGTYLRTVVEALQRRSATRAARR
jgi:hypothetical protein